MILLNMKCTFCGTKHTSGTCCGFCGMTFSKDQSLVSPNEFPKSREAINTLGGHKHTQAGCETYGPPPRQISQPRKSTTKFFPILIALIFLAVFSFIIYSAAKDQQKEPENNPFDERASVTDFVAEYFPPNTLNFSVAITNHTSDIISVSIVITFYENGSYTGGVSVPNQNILPNQTVTRNGSYTHYTISHVSTFEITGWTVFPN